MKVANGPNAAADIMTHPVCGAVMNNTMLLLWSRLNELGGKLFCQRDAANELAKAVAHQCLETMPDAWADFIKISRLDFRLRTSCLIAFRLVEI